jgi:hypothetical protein
MQSTYVYACVEKSKWIYVWWGKKKRKVDVYM